MTDSNKCSLPDHLNEKAEFFCPECKRFMCNKCNKTHSDFFSNFHHQYKLENNKDKDHFTGLCTYNNHFEELIYFCKTHNVLCCGLCLVKIKDEKYGNHSECEVCKLKDIE